MAPLQPRWTFLAFIASYMLLMRLSPYILSSSGWQLDPSIAAYPWNFSPVFAVCLFGGVHFDKRWLAIVLPLGTMLVSDLGIWALTGRADWAFYPSQFVVYGSLVACVLVGRTVRENRTLLRIGGAGFLGCTIFFILTNLAHWAMMDTYPKTPGGLLACYIAAIPYYRNSLLGTAFFGFALFSPLGLSERSSILLRQKLSEPAR